MPTHSGPSRGFVLLLILASTVLATTFVLLFRNAQEGTRDPEYIKAHLPQNQGALGPATLHGHAIASKLANETAKAELGRAGWKLFHTTFARFPDKPTGDESLALKSYVHLFQRLYPCGECAEHFRTILDKFPPQVSSRSAAAAWGCHVHNEVNKSLNKSMFDCSKIGDFYDCGCAEDDADTGKGSAGGSEGRSSGHNKSAVRGDKESTTLELEGGLAKWWLILSGGQ